VELFRKNNSKYYWYDFALRGERYRGSTKETNETRAQKAAALKLAATIKGNDPLDRKPPTLREYLRDFLQFRAVRRDSWQAAQIDRIELHRPDVEEFTFAVGGDLSDDLRLADAASTPNM